MVSGGGMAPFTTMMLYFLTTGVEHMEQRIKALRERMEQQIGQVDSKDKLAAFWQDFLVPDDIKWLYTALTRAVKQVYLVNFRDTLFV